MAKRVETSFRYFPCNPAMERWGINVISCGYGKIPPNHKYPPVIHPEDHNFSWEKGRILNSYCFVYIANGSGVFESFTTDPVKIEGGSIILLRPGLWHRYKPDKSSGWEEYWLEFSGDVAERLIRQSPLSERRGVIRVKNISRLTDAFIESMHIADNEPGGFEYFLSRQAIDIIVTLISELDPVNLDTDKAGAIRNAKQILISNPSASIDLNQLAADVGMSYSSFRKTFKSVTGLTPYQYRLNFVLHLCQKLLVSSDLKVGQISDRMGFSSVYYFSKLFRKKTGLSPIEYRNRQVSE
ncbi:MAG: helix-turn-helix domain-containing protein [Sedimentisphaeraceae bacterium JB056]